MSAMRDMSRAIRHELSEYGPTLQDLPDQELRELTEIVGAFFYDMVGEQDRRGWGSPRPAATVARELKELRELSEYLVGALLESEGKQHDPETCSAQVDWLLVERRGE